MTSFDYTITDPVGIHARPAGLLVKAVKAQAPAVVTIKAGAKTVVASKLVALMQMGIKQGDTISVYVEGGDEVAAAQALEEFFKANL